MTFKDIRIGEKFTFESDKEWWSGGIRKGLCVKTSTRKYRDGNGTEILIGTISCRVVKSK